MVKTGSSLGIISVAMGSKEGSCVGCIVGIVESSFVTINDSVGVLSKLHPDKL